MVVDRPDAIYWKRIRSRSTEPRQTGFKGRATKGVRGSWKPRKLEEDAQEYRRRGCEMYRKSSLAQGEGERGGTETWGRAESFFIE